MMSRRSVMVMVVMAVVVCLGVGLGAGLLLAPAPIPVVAADASGPAQVGVIAQDYLAEATNPVTVATTPTRSYPTSASGVVRATACQAGVPIDSGSKVMMVNDEPVMALHLATPPWRDLESGMKGEDVKDFQTELARLGYAVTADGKYSSRTARAVAKLWATLGVKDRDTLPLSEIIWLPQETAIPSKCDLTIGDSAGPGTTTFTAGGGLTSATVTGLDDATRRVAVLGDDTATAALGADGVVSDPAFLASLEASPLYQQWKSQGSPALTLKTRLIDPVRVVAVPASSLYDIHGSSACLVDQSGHAASVRILASQLGQTFVTAEVLPTSVAVPAPKERETCG
ncbi:MAG: peptidoglycan-binding protein [Propionibacteriaceae bacterium]|jgi:peptidoglycan hydrolase-like protein with peptidoglycan-binding domain|nr:peptidoglycan-binding protein [Propionibacteriaceae bacterium]